MPKSAEVLSAHKRGEESSRAFLPRDAVAHPGYVRLVLQWDSGPAHARAACRKFASLCREENASRGLIVAESSGALIAVLEDALEAATGGMGRRFKLAVVARGSAAGIISKTAASIAARRKAIAKVFSSEHQAAGWLMS